MRDFKELKVWQKAMDLSVAIYQVTAAFPNEEQFGLVSQLRRATVSIPSNIAEGSGRKSAKDFIRFLRIADGSAAEVETQLLLAEKLGFAETSRLGSDAVEVRKMLSGLIAAVRQGVE